MDSAPGKFMEETPLALRKDDYTFFHSFLLHACPVSIEQLGLVNQLWPLPSSDPSVRVLQIRCTSVSPTWDD